MCIGKYCADDTLIHNGKKVKISKKQTILVAIIDDKLTECVRKLVKRSLQFHKHQLLFI